MKNYKILPSISIDFKSIAKDIKKKLGVKSMCEFEKSYGVENCYSYTMTIKGTAYNGAEYLFDIKSATIESHTATIEFKASGLLMIEDIINEKLNEK